MAEITAEIAARVLGIVDAGLIRGVGTPVAGQMCVEAAVCFALGEPHGDEPSCVSSAVRACKITLNDADWSSAGARAKGMRRLALAQLGSRGAVDDVAFAQSLVPLAASYARDASRAASHAASKAASKAASHASHAASYASYAAGYASDAASYASDAARYASKAASDAARYASKAASDAARYASKATRGVVERDEVLSDYAEAVVQILISMDAPGCQWLYLAPLEN